MILNRKTILIISPESWGTIHLSKHHYTIELLKRGNKVYFLSQSNNSISAPIVGADWSNNLFFVNHQISPLINKLRFHFRILYNWYIKLIIPSLRKKLGLIDLLISFDCNGLFPKLKRFRAKETIFFPVDQVPSKLRKEYSGFTYLVSISPVILNSFPDFKGINLLLHHGLSNFFENQNLNTGLKAIIDGRIKFGYIGNLMIGLVLDRKTLRSTIRRFPNCEFHFFGPYSLSVSNIGGDINDEVVDFIAFLEIQDNCFLHGAMTPKDLALAVNIMDGFLICYDYHHDKNKCSNTHKIMEYLSTGKPIISSRISMYDDLDLFPMLKTFDNSGFEKLFEDVVNNWSSHMSSDKQKKRIAFALNNTYEKNVNRLEELIGKNEKNSNG